ncbi:MAG: exo-alpha-sialidase, partial [Clostridia bacterium]|nr:exo-alpha-sialidase [Clostridia bacterium]
MIITDVNELKKYSEGNRLWQGIPGVAVTKNGRIFVGFYSGGIKEEVGNYVLLVKSDDDGKTFSSPVTVVYNKDGGRCFDEVLWIDPLGRLWLFWGYMGDKGEGTYASVCENPDSDNLVWSTPKLIGYDVMMNKPLVLGSGEWLLPIAVWEDSFRGYIDVPTSERENKEKG